MRTNRIEIGLFFLPLILGVGVALMLRGAFDAYGSMLRPVLSPPEWLFPIVWSALYLLIGLAAALVYGSACRYRRIALTVWSIQLAMNLAWPFLFFAAGAVFAAFLLLLALWLTVFVTMLFFFRCSPSAGWLMLPYLLWLTFAAYLNGAIYVLGSQIQAVP